MSATLELTLVALLTRDNALDVSILHKQSVQCKEFWNKSKWKPHKPYAGEDAGAAKPTVGGACVGAERKKFPSKKDLFCTVLKTNCFLVHFKGSVKHKCDHNLSTFNAFFAFNNVTVWKRFHFPCGSNLK